MRESEAYRQEVERRIKTRIVDLRIRGVTTSKGDLMSLAAIGRTLDPPVSRTAVYLVVSGKTESRRIKDAIERELGEMYWIRKNAA